MNLEVSLQKNLPGFRLNLEFSSSEGCLGILGASGSGKSMTLKCIAGIFEPDSGKISASGTVLYDSEKNISLPPQKRRVGYLFQNYALFPRMSVWENLCCGLRGKQKKDLKPVREILERFQLSGLEKRLPGELSGGQQQRVAMARMLLADPAVILLDEPFSALDSFLKEQLQEQMEQLLREFQGPSVMVTHDREEAYRFCKNLLILDHGLVIARGSARDLFRHPGSVQAARLLGFSNLQPAQKADSHTLLVPGWQIRLQTADTIPDGRIYAGLRTSEFTAGQQGENRLVPCSFTIHEGAQSWTALLYFAENAEPVRIHGLGAVPDFSQGISFPPSAVLALSSLEQITE